MGTCMSKDKKAATSAAHTASASSSSSSLSSQGKQIQHLSQDNESTIAIVRPSAAEQNLPITIARPSAADDGKELTSTDKHVVEIRLPIASPSKFKASPASTTLAARAMAAIARPAVEERTSAQSQEEGEEKEEEDDDEVGGGACRDRKGPSKLRNPSPPLFYSSYLSGASFSRDLAAFSRDIASLSSSPLMRSPSVNGAHDLIAAAIKATQSPLNVQAKPHSTNIIFDDCSTTTRSRSLPKRFYGKDSNSNLPPLHKRSTSRDAAMEHQRSMKRKPLVDPCELALSPRLSVRREEASGEYRVCARQAAARKGHHQHGPDLAPSKTPDMGLSWKKKERSPLRRSSTGKVADADQANHELPHLQENQNISQTMHSGSTILNQPRGRPALIERSTNCSTWADTNNQGVWDSFKNFKRVAKAEVEQNDENAGLGMSIIENKLFEEGFQAEATQLECSNSSLYYSGKPRVSAINESDTVAMSMDRVQSIFEALADLNLESSPFSEIEESETEVEGELDLLQFAFDEGFSPRKELQAQQARNMLLKEAAMDAFARPSFHSSMCPEGLEEGKPPSSDLVAFMSMRLNEAEVDTLKIRKVLKLLSIAELEMGKEQKTLFYNQLRMVLDSVKTQDDKNSQTGIRLAGNMKEKAVTARANSWPRSMKEPTHIVVSVESSSNQALNKTPSQNLSLKGISATGVSPTVTQLHEELSLEHPETVLQAIAPCELDGLQVAVQRTCGDLDFSSLLSLEYPPLDKLRYEFCCAHQANEHNIHKADESPNVDLFSAHESQVEQGLVREDYCGVETRNKSTSQVLDGIDDILAKDIHDERAPAANVEIVACTSSNHTLVESVVLNQPDSIPFKIKEACSHEVVQFEGKESAVEGGATCDMPPAELSQQGLDVSLVEDVPGDIHSPERLHYGEDAIDTFLNSRTARRSDDVASEGSFEFHVRSSSASTPLSTPSTPMISSASTPRHLTHLNQTLTAQEIAEIWDAFG